MPGRVGRVLGRGLDLRRDRLLPEALAGATLAAIAIPEALGYARIAGMPVETGLYTMLVPVLVFALLGASRHLVVGADSATAAILASGLAGLAAASSERYVQLAGTATLLLAVLLVVARVVRLGVLANFLSRTVLLGFLAGVGVQVAVGQAGDVLGIPVLAREVPGKIVEIVRGAPGTRAAEIALAAGVVVLILGLRRVNRRIPGALIAVVASVALVSATGLPVALVGEIPAGLPGLAVPALGLDDLRTMLPTALSLAVVVLAQSAATARAYAGRYGETADTDGDVTGLAGANIAAAFTGAFVVNGSPTKTQIADSAGGRSQLAMVWSAVLALVVVLVATPALAKLPLAVLAAVVLLIGVELIDVAGLRRLWAVRRAEFVVATGTAVAVVLLGIETGLVIAVAASLVDHLRRSYSPHSSVLRKSAEGHWLSEPVVPGARTVPGFVVFRFGSGLYFANASRLVEDVTRLLAAGGPVRWFCLDAAAIGDVDYTAGAVLEQIRARLAENGTRLVLSNVIDPVARQLGRYGILDRLGPDAVFGTSGEALEEFTRRE